MNTTHDNTAETPTPPTAEESRRRTAVVKAAADEMDQFVQSLGLSRVTVGKAAWVNNHIQVKLRDLLGVFDTDERHLIAQNALAIALKAAQVAAALDVQTCTCRSCTKERARAGGWRRRLKLWLINFRSRLWQALS